MATAVSGMAGTENFAGASPVSGVAPTVVDGSDGLPVQYLGAVTLTVSAPFGQTFSGAGSWLCYVLFAALGRWSRFPSGDMPAPASGVRDYTYDPCDLIGRFKGSYVKWIPSGITYSGGAASVDTLMQGSPAADGERKVFA